MNIEIANRLIALRKQKGLSQEDLAEKLGISRQAVSKWERAESSPDMTNLISLAKLYQVSLDDLLNMDEEDLNNERYAQQRDYNDDTEEKTSRNEDVIIGNRRYHNKSLRHMLNVFPYPVVCVIVYLLAGFLMNLWHPGWILFLTIPVYYCVANML